MDEFDLSIFSQDQQQPIDQSSSGTSRQDQQRPMVQSASSNTVSNQVIRLSERYQRTLGNLKKRLVAFKEIREKKLKKYCDYEALRLEQWSALTRGEEISGSRHDPNTEKQLKKEYATARRKVWDLRKQLKRFMKRRGLEFQDSDW
ncbi:hypothetical protein BDEG_21653 [Batrachochytrium dendrobatidis JEL423]|uniref:Uncharacterized protein n=1 Tax=Batrachochytrium dendrobatidis (strain JEL423) TaxID=403673 RepID=A0A177WD91_BATDL|nr:hypothetical protein BDEG_21653 [Batrachochytrium dendrobatidis JEL423]